MKKEELENKTYEQKILLSLLIIILLVIFVIIFSFITYTYINANDDNDGNRQTTDNVSMTYTESTNGITLENAVPISDEKGKKLNADGQYFDFTIKTNVVKNTKVVYEIVALKEENSTLSDNEIKIYLEKQQSGTYEEVLSPTVFTPLKEKTLVGSPKGAMVLLKVIKKSSETDNYRVRLWVNESTNNLQEVKNYSIKINVYGMIQ